MFSQYFCNSPLPSATTLSSRTVTQWVLPWPIKRSVTLFPVLSIRDEVFIASPTGMDTPCCCCFGGRKRKGGRVVVVTTPCAMAYLTHSPIGLRMLQLSGNSKFPRTGTRTTNLDGALDGTTHCSCLCTSDGNRLIPSDGHQGSAIDGSSDRIQKGLPVGLTDGTTDTSCCCCFGVEKGRVAVWLW